MIQFISQKLANRHKANRIGLYLTLILFGGSSSCHAPELHAKYAFLSDATETSGTCVPDCLSLLATQLGRYIPPETWAKHCQTAGAGSYVLISLRVWAELMPTHPLTIIFPTTETEAGRKLIAPVLEVPNITYDADAPLTFSTPDQHRYYLWIGQQAGGFHMALLEFAENKSTVKMTHAQTDTLTGKPYEELRELISDVLPRSLLILRVN